MPTIRGSIILCDHLARMEGGKWLLVGTYNRMLVTQPVWTGALALFIRFQTERTGNHEVMVRIVHRDLPPTAPALARVSITVPVADPHLPCDCGLQTPTMSIACPVPDDQRPPGSVVPLHLLIWAEVDGYQLSSAPVDLLFTRPGAPAAP